MENTSASDGTINAKNYRLGKEKVYLSISVVVTILFYVWVIKALLSRDFSAMITPAIFFGFLIIFLFLHLLGMAAIRINSVKAGPQQFPEVWNAMVQLSSQMGLKTPPDLYILNVGGELNAFAARLISRKLMVVFSDLAEALIEDNDQKQLNAVVAHELAHHALNHTHFYNWFLGPASMIPFLGAALSRTREYSADRIMKAIIQENASCERALVKLVSGKSLGNRVNIQGFTRQINTETGFFIWLSEKFASHPHLPKRIKAMQTI